MRATLKKTLRVNVVFTYKFKLIYDHKILNSYR